MPGIPAAVQRQANDADREIEAALKREEEGRQDTSEPEAPPAEPTSAQPEPVLEEEAPTQSVDAQEYARLKAEHERTLEALTALKGKYSAEVPRYAEQVRLLTKEMAELKKRMESIPKSPERPSHLKYVKPEELEDADPAVLDLNARMMRGVVEEMLGNQQTQSTESEVQKDLEAVKQRLMWDRVEVVHPGAAAMNASNDPAWESFLNTVEPMSGLTYGELGNDAIRVQSPDRLIRIIDAFLATGAVLPESASPEAGNLRTQVRPKSARSVATERAPAAQPFIKESTVNKFYTDVTKGVYRGREDEAKALVEKYERAFLEGRVKPGV